MQMPIPQNGVRGSPRTENRHGSLAIIMAAATLVTSATLIARPFTVMEKPSLNTGTPSSCCQFASEASPSPALAWICPLKECRNQHIQYSTQLRTMPEVAVKS